MICSSLNRVFFIVRPPPNELTLTLREFQGSRSRLCVLAKLLENGPFFDAWK